MRARFVIAAGLSLIASSALSAQTPSPKCQGSVPTAAQDACQQALDVFDYMAPQLGLGIVGGNATLGQGGALGGLPHFSIGLRANLVQGTMPRVQDFQQSYLGIQPPQELPTDNQLIPVPTVDAAVGIFKGLPLGLTNVGGVDLLVSVSYIPEVARDEFEVTVPDGAIKFGFGARVGLIQESLLLPGVSVTYLRRDLPTVNLLGTSGNDTIGVNNLKVETSAWRVVASKNLVALSFAIGAGQDKYETGATGYAIVNPIAGRETTGDITLEQSLTRTNIFADVALNMPFFKIVAEVGQASGGDLPTYNTFQGKAADASRIYGSLGVRFTF